jgi:PAS domain S-box-containing protein/diguanylate cyclase (GGDEF)-like protein
MEAKHTEQQPAAGREHDDAEQPYRWLFDHVSDGLLVFTPQGRVVAANANVCRMLGYARNEVIGLATPDIFPPSRIAHERAALGVIGSDAGAARAFEFRRKDESLFSAEYRSLMLPDGNVLGLVRTRGGGADVEASRLAAIVESSDDAIVGKDLNGIITSWNAGAEKIFGYREEEMLGTSIMRLIPPERQDEERQILEKMRRGERVEHFETVRKSKDQRLIDVSVTVSPIRDTSGKVVGASKIARDITQVKAREREMDRLSRLYAALAQINQEIVRSRSRDMLFDRICRLLIEYGGLTMAWIGCYDAQTRQLRPVAQHGDTSGYLGQVRVYSDERPEGRGPSGVAYRSGRPYICNDMMDDPATLPWREDMKRHGFLGVASFPVRERGEVSCVLTVYAGQQGFFQREEVLLLEEAAGDLSFALESIGLEESRRQFEIAAQSEKSFSDTMVESMPGIVYLFNREGQLLRWNNNLKTVTGYSDAEIAGLRPLEFFSAAERALVERKIADAFESGEAMVEASLQRRDGTVIPYFLIARRIESGGQPCLLGIGVDLSRIRQYEHRLAEQDTILLEMSAMAHIGGWAFDPVTGEGVWTEEVARIHDVDPGAATSASFGLSFYRGEHLENIQAAVREAVEHGKPYDLELELVSAKGVHKWVRSMSHPVLENGKVVKVRGTIQDITERKLAELRIKRLNRVYAVLSEINSLIVRVQDREELFREACKIATTEGNFRMALLATVDRGRVVPQAWEGPEQGFLAEIRDLLSSGRMHPEALVPRAIREQRALVSNDTQNDPAVMASREYGEAGIHSVGVFPLMVAGKAAGVLALFAGERDFFHDEEIELLLELTHDIAFAIDHLNKQERLNYLAYYDALTGLANRNLFLERVGQFVRTLPAGRQLAVFLLDLERFKSINDSLGHSAGDALLVEVADWLKENAGDPALVARVGADQFAAVMPEVRETGGIAHFVEHSLAALAARTFTPGGRELRISGKVGIALCPDDGTDAETLFRNAEAALKAAKRRGLGYLFHARQMTESVAARLSLENQLRKAIENKEFVLHYQPKLQFASGKVSAAEALIRWQDPLTGLVPPDRFIPVLEETGMIFEVGRWALEQAVADSLRWRRDGLPAVRVAVNVSALQLRSEDFVEEIRRRIAVDDRAAGALQLELTESMVMEDIRHSIEMLQAIREMGVTIAIDDFGTGFSSLSHLVRLPLDALKIDRAFIASMTEGPRELALVSTIINLTHSLNLKVVAEGVETEEQSRLLRLLGCDEMQGYLFSRPVPAEEFAARFLLSGG